VVTTQSESTTHGFVEPEFTELIALLEAWQQDIDSEPFAYESDWATVESPAFRVVATWAPRQRGLSPRTLPPTLP
jgi:hypothetical protein